MLEDLARADEATRSCVEAAVWSMPETRLIDALEAVHRLEQRVVALKLALVRELDGRGTAVAQGSTSTAVWLRDRLRLPVRNARRVVELAVVLDAGPGGSSAAGASPGSTSPGAGFAGVRAALADGRVDVAQARVIAETVATVRAEAGPEAADQAADLLVDWAGEFDAGLLRRLGTRILDHVAPEVAERATEKTLAAEAARANRDRHLTLAHHGDGRLRLTGNLDPETAALLRAALDPLTRPSGPDDTRTPGQRRHDALADLCQLTLRTGQHPSTAATPPSSSSPRPTRPSPLNSAPAPSTLASFCRPTPSAASPATPPSFPPSSAAPGKSSTSAGSAASSPARYAARSSYATAAAPSPAATAHPAGAKATTSTTGPTAAQPASPTPSCSAATTTAKSTTTTGRSASPPTAYPNSSHLPGSTPNAAPAATTTTARTPAPRISPLPPPPDPRVLPTRQRTGRSPSRQHPIA